VTDRLTSAGAEDERRSVLTRVGAAAVAVLLLSACLGGSKAASTWGPFQASLRGGLDPASPNVCNRGERDCVAAVAEEMRRRARPQLASCSHRAAFALMYLRVTEGVLDKPVDFANKAYINHLDALFADLYFRSTDEFAAGRADGVPRAWRVAFQAADARTVTGLGDLMLSMNAHISRDLPFALVASRGDLDAGRADYDKVNELLIDAQAPIVQETGARLDPTISQGAGLALAFSKQSVGETIALWRTEALANAKRLAGAAPGPPRDAVAASIEEIAGARADAIALATRYVPVIMPGADARAAHCKQHHGTLDGPPR
jgi:hypothetical protein